MRIEFHGSTAGHDIARDLAGLVAARAGDGRGPLLHVVALAGAEAGQAELAAPLLGGRAPVLFLLGGAEPALGRLLEAHGGLRLGPHLVGREASRSHSAAGLCGVLGGGWDRPWQVRLDEPRLVEGGQPCLFLGSWAVGGAVRGGHGATRPGPGAIVVLGDAAMFRDDRILERGNAEAFLSLLAWLTGAHPPAVVPALLGVAPRTDVVTAVARAQLPPPCAERLGARADATNWSAAPSPDELALRARSLGRELDGRTDALLWRLAEGSRPEVAVVVSGLPVGRGDPSASRARASALSRRADALLLGTTSVGTGMHPVPHVEGGSLVEDVFPEAAAAGVDAGPGRAGPGLVQALPGHPDSPALVALLCVEGGPGAAVALASVDAALARVPVRDRRLLQRPVPASAVAAGAPARPGRRGSHEAAPIAPPVVEHRLGRPSTVSLPLGLRAALRGEPRAAVESLIEACAEVAVEVPLTPGDLLVFDNRRALHRIGAPPLAPAGRPWLKRCSLVADLAAFGARRGSTVLTGAA